MNTSTMLFRNHSNENKVVFYSALGQSLVIDANLEEVTPFEKKINSNNAAWDLIDLDDLNATEYNLLMEYAEEEVKELEAL